MRVRREFRRRPGHVRPAPRRSNLGHRHRRSRPCWGSGPLPSRRLPRRHRHERRRPPLRALARQTPRPHPESEDGMARRRRAAIGDCVRAVMHGSGDAVDTGITAGRRCASLSGRAGSPILDRMRMFAVPFFISSIAVRTRQLHLLSSFDSNFFGKP
jgi:hypothetical protein